MTSSKTKDIDKAKKKAREKLKKDKEKKAKKINKKLLKKEKKMDKKNKIVEKTIDKLVSHTGTNQAIILPPEIKQSILKLQPKATTLNKVVSRALLIGINYRGSDNSLNGCINDANNLRQVLVTDKIFGLTQTNILSMTDDLINTIYYPTKSNILRQLQSLVTLAKSNLQTQYNFIVSYSGHGGGVRDQNQDEADRQDEVIFPVDYQINGYISDDELNQNFVQQLPTNVRLIMFIDACNSGTALDLRYNYTIDRTNSLVVGQSHKPTRSNVIMISGCRDNQLSADAYLVDSTTINKYQGAMTASFLASYKSNPKITYYNLITSMRTWLTRRGFDQICQLSSGQLIDTKKKVIFT